MLAILADTFSDALIDTSTQLLENTFIMPINQMNKDLQEQFTMLKKCCGKFECLSYKMLFIQGKNLT